MRQKIFRRRIVIPPPPPLLHKIFDTRDSLKHRRVPHEFFRHCETKSFDKIVMPPSYGWKFSIKEFFWNTKVFSNETFRYSETKTFRRKIVIHPPLLIHKIVFPTRNFLKHRMVPWRSVFGPVRWKFFRQNRDAFPLLCLKIFDTRILSKYRKCSPTNFIGTVRHKIFQRSLVISPSYA